MQKQPQERKPICSVYQNNSSKYNALSNLSFNGGNLTNCGGMVLFKKLFQALNLEERIAKYLVTDDKRRYYRYSDVDIRMQFLFQILVGFDTEYVCKELREDAYFPQILESQQVASQPTLSRFFSRVNTETVRALGQINIELVQTFLQTQNTKQLIVDVDSAHFTTHGNQEGSKGVSRILCKLQSRV
ncbi:transposase [Streptococcus danieliae]|uniref:Transposase n=1 Tax=Streptococcus danieliae TaxID=747656 RepID=A0A7Z0M6R8_9STRE|nr:transposase [Streptococcus danieliae]NYS96925.1 transposase [Streptococcus danieliae]